MRVLFDSRPASADRTGIGRYAQTLAAVGCGQVAGHELLDGRDCLSFASAWEEELALPALLEREGVDAFHSPLFRLPSALPARGVVTIHDAIPATHPHLVTAAFRELWAEAAEAAARAAAVVCPSAAAKADVVAALSLAPERVHVVPETPHPLFRPASQDEQQGARRRRGLGQGPFLLALGALELRKAPAVALDALQARPDLPPLVFVGPAGAVDLTGEAARRGLSARVRHLGVLPDEDVVALLSAASALVFPSLAEGFGLPLVEAVAVSTPVVASALPAVREAAGEAALLVPPGDPSALAAGVARVLADPGFAAELRARGQARLSAFSPAALRKALGRVYDALERGAA